MRLPNLVIIGAQKSATSFVQQCLAAHPDVWFAPAEVPFFEDGVYDPARLDRVARLLPRDLRGVRWFGIKRPDYLAMPGVPERLGEHMPDARLLAVLRHPVDRSVSAYYHYVRYCMLPDLPLDAGLRRILDTEPAPGFSPEWAVLDYGCYATALERYERHYARDRIGVFLHEDVRDDPERVYGEILGFLDLPADAAGPSFAERKNVGVYDPRRIRFLRRVQRLTNRVDPQRNSWTYRFGPLGMAAYFLARQIDQRILARAGLNRPEPLAPDLRARLLAHYADETTRLESRLRRDLPHWRM